MRLRASMIVHRAVLAAAADPADVIHRSHVESALKERRPIARGAQSRMCHQPFIISLLKTSSTAEAGLVCFFFHAMFQSIDSLHLLREWKNGAGGWWAGGCYHTMSSENGRSGTQKKIPVDIEDGGHQTEFGVFLFRAVCV